MQTTYLLGLFNLLEQHSSLEKNLSFCTSSLTKELDLLKFCSEVLLQLQMMQAYEITKSFQPISAPSHLKANCFSDSSAK